jgi:hypothetical protein
LCVRLLVGHMTVSSDHCGNGWQYASSVFRGGARWGELCRAISNPNHVWILCGCCARGKPITTNVCALDIAGQARAVGM